MNLKQRKKTTHKGQNGRVLIVGGSEDYIGSPALVGLSALATLRAGADLVTVASPEKVAWAINCIAPDLITKKIKCSRFEQNNVKEIISLSKNVDVVVVGNGITINEKSKKFMREIIRKINKPIVIDAGALRVIKIQEVKNAVLLPHRGELAELLSNSRIKEKDVQKILKNNVLVKKGHPATEIISKTKKASNRAGNAGMTHGGTGDVLAGIVAGLIAQGNDLFTSAKVAAYVNGKSGEYLYKKLGFGYLASDLVEVFPLFLKKFQRMKK